MGIFNRLGSVINSYINDFGEQTNLGFKSSREYRYNDPDLDAAFEELNDYLSNDDARFEKKQIRKETETARSAKIKLPPEELRADFELLKVPFGADDETCKAAYKKMLKLHHPDRHVGHEGNYKKATERMAKINAAWDRIEKWRQTERSGGK
jgi:DnaJ-domain-containing protein 1